MSEIDPIELAELVAETCAKEINRYESGRIGLRFDTDQHFDVCRSSIPSEYEIVRVERINRIEISNNNDSWIQVTIQD